MSKNIGNIFNFDCTKCEYNRHCYGGNLGNQYRFCQKSKEKLESFDELQQKNKKYKEVIDKAIDKAIEYINLIVLGETLNGEPVLFKEEAEGQYLLDVLKEVE